MEDLIKQYVDATVKATKAEMVRRFMKIIPHNKESDISGAGKIEIDGLALANLLRQIKKELE